MTLADKLQKPFFPKFPNIKSEFEWSNYSLDKLAINKFDNFREVKLSKNFIVYVGDPVADEDEIQNYVEGAFSGVYYKDKNNNNEYEKEFDSKLADIRLFISYDGAYLLQNYQKTSVDKDEIAIFLEVQKDDVFSDNVLLIKAGENAIQYTEEILKHNWTKEKYTLTEDEIKSLLEAVSTGRSFWDKIVATVNKIENYVADSITDLEVTIFNEIADFFGDTIRLDEKRWNSGHPEYSIGQIEKDLIKFLNQKNKEIDSFLQAKDYIPDWAQNIIRIPQKVITRIIEAIEEYKDDVENLWAFTCGLWNGLMDLISSIFALLKLLFQGIKAHQQYKENEGYYKSLALEYLDNALQAMVNVDWKVVLQKGLISYIELQQYIYLELPKELWNKAQALNKSEINYYEGYIIFNILEFLLPPLKLAKLAKAGKLEKVVTIFEDIVANVTKAGKQVAKKADEVTEIFFRMVDDFIKILKKGTEDVSKFIDEIYQVIKKWLQETFGIGKKVSKSNFDEFNKIYGKLVAKGTPIIKSKYDLQIKDIIKKLDYPIYKSQANNALSKYKKNSKIKNKLDDVTYLLRHKQLSLNKKAGQIAEDVVNKYLNGKISPPKSAIKIPPKKRRYPDNFHKGTLREVKSGQISMNYKKQIDFDIELLKKGTIKYKQQTISKIEWHAVNGIDEVVLKYIQTELRSNNIPIEKFQVILY